MNAGVYRRGECSNGLIRNIHGICELDGLTGFGVFETYGNDAAVRIRKRTGEMRQIGLADFQPLEVESVGLLRDRLQRFEHFLEAERVESV